MGSANLTRAAWSGTNVEAVVVRQALSAGAYDAFVNAKAFVPHPWKGAAALPRVESKPSAPVIPLAWAGLDVAPQIVCAVIWVPMLFVIGRWGGVPEHGRGML